MPGRDDLEGLRIYRARSLLTNALFIFFVLAFAMFWLFYLWMGDLRVVGLITVLGAVIGYVWVRVIGPAAVAVGADRFGVRTWGGWHWLSREEAREITQSRGWPPTLPGQLSPAWQEKWMSTEMLIVPLSPRPSYSTPVMLLRADEFPEYTEMVAALAAFFTSETDPLTVPADAPPVVVPARVSYWQAGARLVGLGFVLFMAPTVGPFWQYISNPAPGELRANWWLGPALVAAGALALAAGYAVGPRPERGEALGFLTARKLRDLLPLTIASTVLMLWPLPVALAAWAGVNCGFLEAIPLFHTLLLAWRGWP